MMLTRSEKRALVFLSASFLCGLLFLGLRSLGRERTDICLAGVAETVGGVEAAAPLNINRAGIAELVTLPGIGEKYARRIVKLRQKKGRFSSLEELLEVEGIGPRRLAKIRQMICLE